MTETPPSGSCFPKREAESDLVLRDFHLTSSAPEFRLERVPSWRNGFSNFGDVARSLEVWRRT